jgi:hypothetical protein
VREIRRGWCAPPQHEWPLRTQAEPALEETPYRPLLLARDPTELDVGADRNVRQRGHEQSRRGALVEGGEDRGTGSRRDHVAVVGEQELGTAREEMGQIVGPGAAEDRSIDAVRMVEVGAAAVPDPGWAIALGASNLPEAPERRVDAKSGESSVATDRSRIGR